MPWYLLLCKRTEHSRKSNNLITTYLLFLVLKKDGEKRKEVLSPDSPATAEEKWAKRVRQEGSKRTGKYQQAPKKQLKINAV